jgi:hypothetical protein
MKHLTTIGLVTALLFLAVGWQRDVSSQTPSKAGVTPVDASRRIADFKIKLPTRATDAECKTPKPRTVGCTTVCKPCEFSVCVNGKWVREQVDTRDFCKPPSKGGVPGEEGFGCLIPKGETLCPQDCDFCFHEKE